MSASPLLFSELFFVKCVFFSGNALLLYDHLLTFSLEVQYIWRAPWTAVKVGFLVNRYGNAIGQTVFVLGQAGYVPGFCGIFHIYSPFFMVFSSESIRILVLMRAWAIWGCQYGVAVFLITLYVLYVVCLVGMVIYTTVLVSHFPPRYLSEGGMCTCRTLENTWLLFLMIIVLSMVWYSLRKLLKESRGVYPSPLAHLLVRDAVLFYATSVFNNVVAMICWTMFREDPRSWLELGLAFPLLSVVGQRLILNLRGFQAGRFATRDISREVDRQMAAMGDLLWPDLEDHASLEQSERNESRGMGTTENLAFELREVQRSC